MMHGSVRLLLQLCCGLSAIALASGARAQTVVLDTVAPIALTTSQVQAAVSINPLTGNVVVRTSLGNYNQCTNTQVNPPTIIGFSPVNAVVEPSTTITLTWSTSGATSCTPQQGGSTVWSSLGTLPANGSQNLTAPAATGTLTFQLTCTNGQQNVSQSTQVSVQPAQGGSCPPAFANGTETSWQGNFQLWPSFGVNSRVFVSNGSYLSFSFTATSVGGQFGTVGTSNFPGDGDGQGQMSISRTAGCFASSQLPSGCLGQTSRSPSISWINGSAANRCPLTSGQTYWVNLTYSGYQGNGANCPGGTCGVDMANFAQD